MGTHLMCSKPMVPPGCKGHGDASAKKGGASGLARLPKDKQPVND